MNPIIGMVSHCLAIAVRIMRASSILIVVAMLAWHAPTVIAQIQIAVPHCVDPRGCDLGSSSGGGSRSSGDYQGPNLWRGLGALLNPGPSAAEQARQQRIDEAHTANEQGVQAYNNSDWAKAVTAFQEAANKNPDSPTIRKNLAAAQERLANAQAELQLQRQARASAERMQQSIQSLAQSLNTTPISGGLDFDGRTSGTAPGASGGGLDFTASVASPGPARPAPELQSGDPRVVDARNVPSGLPKGVDSAIAGAYQNAPPGVSDRVRKGFQAVMARDWKVAKAWFEEALNRDPGNTGLKRLVALAESTPERNTQAAPLTAAPVNAPHRPSPDDVYYYIPSKGYYRMTLEAATLRQATDTMMGVPAGSIVNMR